jgi:hypothetical protein
MDAAVPRIRTQRLCSTGPYAGSDNGNPPGSGPGNRGSNPCPAVRPTRYLASNRGRLGCGHRSGTVHDPPARWVCRLGSRAAARPPARRRRPKCSRRRRSGRRCCRHHHRRRSDPAGCRSSSHSTSRMCSRRRMRSAWRRSTTDSRSSSCPTRTPRAPRQRARLQRRSTLGIVSVTRSCFRSPLSLVNTFRYLADAVSGAVIPNHAPPNAQAPREGIWAAGATGRNLGGWRHPDQIGLVTARP